MNKEQHAQNIIDSISDYFLTQRVKASQEDYAERLQKHHAVIVAAMRAKQNADPGGRRRTEGGRGSGCALLSRSRIRNP